MISYNHFFCFASCLCASLVLMNGCGKDGGKCAAYDSEGIPPGGLCAVDDDCAGAGKYEGICIAGVCGVSPTDSICESDGTNKGCPSGFSCKTLDLEKGPGHACLPSCECTEECGGECDTEDICAPRINQNCDPSGCSISRGPDIICKTPPALGAGPYFTNVTEEVGLGSSGEDVTGNRIALVDTNNNGYPDLFVHSVTTARDDPDSDPPKRYKRVLLNEEGGDKKRRFRDFTQESGYTATREDGVSGRAASFAVFADVNNDGNVDIFSGTYVDGDFNVEDPGDRSEILLGNGDGTFELAAQSETSPEDRRSTTSAAFTDFDRDGRIDLFVGFGYGVFGIISTAQQDHLYQGNGEGSFYEVTDLMGLETQKDGLAEGLNHRPTYGVTVCDVDSDGDPDFITSSYGRQWNMLWENDFRNTFSNIAPQVGFDADDRRDYSDNELFRCHCHLEPDAPECDPNPGSPMISCDADYWRVGFDDQPFRLAGTTFSTVCGDIDNDGDMDLFNAEIRHWYHGSSSDPSELLVNTGEEENWVFERPGNQSTGLHRDWPTIAWDEGDITAAFMDFDNDGLQDILLGCSDYPNTHAFLFRQLADNTFEDISTQSGADHYYGNAVAFADYDRDGDLDIFVGSSTMRCGSDPNCTWQKQEVHLYQNNVGQDSNWMAIKLTGAGVRSSNGSAIGARVLVTAGGVTQTREVNGGYGHFGIQNTLTQHFGLGDNCIAETVTIIWPDLENTTVTYEYVPANYFITINEADSSILYSPAP